MVAEWQKQICKNGKAPPTLGKYFLYVNWKKEIKIWEAFTSIPEEKHAPAIFMTLTRETREAILDIDIEKLTEKTGVSNLMGEHDKMYLKEKSSHMVSHGSDKLGWLFLHRFIKRFGKYPWLLA